MICLQHLKVLQRGCLVPSEIEAYKKKLASNPEGERYFNTVSISHSLMSKTYHLVIDSAPLTALDENGDSIIFEPASIQSQGSSQSNDLDQEASYTISDEYNILDGELDLIPLDNEESPVVVFRGYLSDYLDTPIETFTYQVKAISQEKGIFTLKTGVPDLNSDQTGQVYDLDTFPMMRSLF